MASDVARRWWWIGPAVLAVAVVAVLAVSLTGDDAGPGLEPDGVCTRDDVDGCEMAGLVFDPPLDLDAALAMGADLGGEPIAVYRVDRVCIEAPAQAPGGDPEIVPSRFAYVDAPLYEQRAWDAVDRGFRPPITGQHIAQSFWDRWANEWRAAQQPGVEFEAVAVWLPVEARTVASTDPRVAEVVDVIPRRGDSTDPVAYPGELYVDEFPVGVLSEPAIANC